MVENEISIMRTVRHQNIVELIEEFETPKEIFLVLELVKVRFAFSIYLPLLSPPGGEGIRDSVVSLC